MLRRNKKRERFYGVLFTTQIYCPSKEYWRGLAPLVLFSHHMQTSACLQSPRPAANIITLRPDATASHTSLIQKALNACSANGGGTVVLESGQYHSGTLVMRSHVTLHLEKGAILSATATMSEYLRREGPEGARLVASEGSTALIFAENAEHIALTGEGVLDGSGKLFFKRRKADEIPDWVDHRKKTGTWVPGFETNLTQKTRPRALILFSQCRHIRLELAHVQDSPAWTIHLLACTNAILRGIALRGALNGSNTDGIDLDSCSDVLIEDCDILTGDDAIALKSTNLWGLKAPTRRITIRGCRLRSTTHGFTIGTETQDDFEDIVLEDSTIERPGEYRTLTGIGLSIVDGAAIRGIRISNVTIDDAIAPLQIRLGNAGRGQKTPSPGTLEDITLENIMIRGAQGNNLIAGLSGHPLKNITLRNVSFELAAAIDPSGVLTKVPELDAEFPCHEIWRFLPAYGLFCRNVRGLDLSDVTFTKTVEDSRPAMLLEDILNA